MLRAIITPPPGMKQKGSNVNMLAGDSLFFHRVDAPAGNYWFGAIFSIDVVVLRTISAQKFPVREITSVERDNEKNQIAPPGHQQMYHQQNFELDPE